MFVAKGIFTALSNMYAKIKDKDTENIINDNKLKIYENIYNLKLVLAEYKYIARNNYYDYFYKHLDNYIQHFKSCTDAVQLKNELKLFLNEFENFDFEQIDNYSYTRAAIDLSLIRKLFHNINNRNRKFTLFHESCSNGYVFEEAKNASPYVECYGLEYEDYLIQKARSFAEKIIKGKLHGCRISNNSFDVIVTCPDIYAGLEDNMKYSMISKPEKQTAEPTIGPSDSAMALC